MGRWEPNARGRLAQEALALFAEQGFERTTAAEIAQRAGLTERTFFRHFTDKRDVLFDGGEVLEARLAATTTAAPEAAPPMDVVRTVLDDLATVVQTNPERARTRDAVIAAHPELRERELTKHAGLAAAIVEALHDRGVPRPTAELAAETGLAAFKVAFARWATGPADADLPTVLRTVTEELAELLQSVPIRRPARVSRPTGTG